MIASPAATPALRLSSAPIRAVDHCGSGDMPRRVCEWTYRYEDEGSERLSRGSVTVGGGSWWSASLAVPEGEPRSGDDIVLVQLERHGVTPADYRGSVDAELVLPRTEIGAIVTLLAGVVDQARRSGMLRR